MAIQAGKRYLSPRGGAEFIVTKGGEGTLMDGDVALLLKDDPNAKAPENAGDPSDIQVQLGKRFASPNGGIELLCIKAGYCDLRIDGEPMEMLQPKVLPSAD
jgi:hypothetical protein